MECYTKSIVIDIITLSLHINDSFHLIIIIILLCMKILSFQQYVSQLTLHHTDETYITRMPTTKLDAFSDTCHMLLYVHRHMTMTHHNTAWSHLKFAASVAYLWGAHMEDHGFALNWDD